MADYIPIEIQEQIMLRLPTKSLMRFRSVSKPWKSKIHSSKFIADYSFHHTHQRHLLVTYPDLKKFDRKCVSFVDDDTFPQQKFSLDIPKPEFSDPAVVSSSQGLFFLYRGFSDPIDDALIHVAALWNPSVRKSVVIDMPPGSIKPENHLVIGFGICPHSGDPKLVKIEFDVNVLNEDATVFTPWQVEVYALSSRAWRGIPTINQPRESVNLRWEQVVIDGIIYWLAIDSISMMVASAFEGYNMIVSFDMTSEKFMEVSFPDTLARANNHNVVISKLKESLVVVEAVKEAEKQVYDVWMIERDVPNTFTKLFTINSPYASIQRLLGFSKGYESIFELRRTVSVVNDFVIYNVNSENINYIGISANGLPCSAHSYMETLLLLDH